MSLLGTKRRVAMPIGKTRLLRCSGVVGAWTRSAGDQMKTLTPAAEQMIRSAPTNPTTESASRTSRETRSSAPGVRFLITLPPGFLRTAEFESLAQELSIQFLKLPPKDYSFFKIRV